MCHQLTDLVERIEHGPLGSVRQVGHGLGQYYGPRSHNEGHQGGADHVQLQQGRVSQLEPEQQPGQAVETDVYDEAEVRQSCQGGLGVVDGDSLGVNLLLGAALVGGAGFLQLVSEGPEHFIQWCPAGPVIALKEPFKYLQYCTDLQVFTVQY